jgi:hypothetical protein
MANDGGAKRQRCCPRDWHLVGHAKPHRARETVRLWNARGSAFVVDWEGTKMKQMFDPFRCGGSQHREASPERAFDSMLESYVYSLQGRRDDGRPPIRMGVSAIPVEDARRLFVGYVSYWEGFYRNVSQALNDHMTFCTSPSPIFAQMRKHDMRGLFSQGYVINADRRSGKTAALFDEAEEVSMATSSRVAIVAPCKDFIMAEAVRRRLEHATPGQFNRLEFFGENELHKLEGLSRDVMVDEWWGLSERTRETLAGRFNIMAAVGTLPHGARIPITRHARRDEDGYYGRNPDKYNPMAMARIGRDDGF